MGREPEQTSSLFRAGPLPPETWPRAAWIDLEKNEMEETQLSFCWEEAGSMALVQAAQGTHSGGTPP